MVCRTACDRLLRARLWKLYDEGQFGRLAGRRCRIHKAAIHEAARAPRRVVVCRVASFLQSKKFLWDSSALALSCRGSSHGCRPDDSRRSADHYAAHSHYNRLAKLGEVALGGALRKVGCATTQPGTPTTLEPLVNETGPAGPH